VELAAAGKDVGAGISNLDTARRDVQDLKRLEFPTSRRLSFVASHSNHVKSLDTVRHSRPTNRMMQKPRAVCTCVRGRATVDAFPLSLSISGF